MASPHMIEPKAHRMLEAIESKHDLLALEVDGWCVWPLFRWLVFVALADRGSAYSPTELWPHRERVSIAVRDLIRFPFLSKSRMLVVANASNRSEYERGWFKDIYFDDLLQGSTSYVKLEHPNTKAFRDATRAALVKSDLTSTPFTALGSALTRSGRPASLTRMGARISSILRKAEGLEEFTEQRVSTALLQFYWQKKLYGRLLKRVRPEFLLIVNAYGDHAVVAAAKEQGAEVIEFQHGSLDRYHPGYSWSSSALTQKERMPLPDRIFLYGDHWRDELEANGFWSRELRVVGSPRIDRYRGREQQRYSVPTLAVTMQGLDVDPVLKFLREFLRLVSKRSEVQLLVKLHPTETATKSYETILGDRREARVIQSAQEPSTFELLVRSHLHASVASTCHVEAVALGTPTVILPFTYHDLVIHLRDDVCFFFAKNPEQLVDVFLHRPDPVSELPGRAYFAPGAIDNIRRELSL